MRRKQKKTILLLGALSAGLIALGGLAGPELMWVMVALTVVMNVGVYFFSDRLVLRMHGAKELPPDADPQLHAMMGELACRAQIPRPRLFLMEDAAPNAFATGRDPAHGAVAVTTGLRALYDGRELRGVLAHELAHIKHRDILVATIAAGVAGP